MKAILSFLLCFVFLESQVFAIHGGVPYGNLTGSSVSVTGTYAGVLIGPTNQLGLFTMTAPATGLATGTAFIYAAGVAYNGTVNGFADSGKGTIQGVFDTKSSFTYSIQTGTDNNGNAIFKDFILVAGGQFKATVGGSDVSGSLPRISGTADITANDINNASFTDTYVVDGVKQTSS